MNARQSHTQHTESKGTPEALIGLRDQAEVDSQ